jgi:DNA-directed RNA polymerase alpha subunit
MNIDNNREPAPPGQGEQQYLAFPRISQPAQRALANAGYTDLGQLAAVSEREIARLHGMGPKALNQLREALAAHGLSFAGE